MPEERLLQDYLNDMIESINDIKDFTSGMTIEEFARDRKTVNAVVRSLEIIGEAANKIPSDTKREMLKVAELEMKRLPPILQNKAGD